MFQKIKNIVFGDSQKESIPQTPESKTRRFLEFEGDEKTMVVAKVYGAIPYMLGQDPETEPIVDQRFKRVYRWLKDYNPKIEKEFNFLANDSDVELLTKAAFNQPPYFDKYEYV